MRELDFPGQLFEAGRDDYELYEEDGEFVLSVELPGFDVEDIDVTWDDGMVNIAAQYRNGILEVRLPVTQGAPTRGKEIEIEG